MATIRVPARDIDQAAQLRSASGSAQGVTVEMAIPVGPLSVPAFLDLTVDEATELRAMLAQAVPAPDGDGPSAKLRKATREKDGGGFFGCYRSAVNRSK